MDPEIPEIEDVPSLLLPCASCGRTFRPEALAKHAKVCEKTLMKKRKQFDSAKQRLQGTEIETFVTQPITKNPRKKEPQINPSKSKIKEKIDLAKTIQVVKKPLESPTTIQVKPSDHEECPYCGRSFGPKAFERHTEFCKEQHQKLKLTPTVNNEAKERLKVRTSYRGPLTNKVLNRDRYQPNRNRDPSPMATSLTELRDEGTKSRALMRNASLRSSLRSRPTETVAPPPLRRTMTQINPPRSVQGSREDNSNQLEEKLLEASNKSSSATIKPKLYSREPAEKKMKSSDFRTDSGIQQCSPKKRFPASGKEPQDLNDVSVNQFKELRVTSAKIERIPAKLLPNKLNLNNRSKLPLYNKTGISNLAHKSPCKGDSVNTSENSLSKKYFSDRMAKFSGGRFSDLHNKNIEHSYKNLAKSNHKTCEKNEYQCDSLHNHYNANYINNNQEEQNDSNLHLSRTNSALFSNDSDSSIISLTQSDGQFFDGPKVREFSNVQNCLSTDFYKCREKEEGVISSGVSVAELSNHEPHQNILNTNIPSINSNDESTHIIPSSRQDFLIIASKDTFDTSNVNQDVSASKEGNTASSCSEMDMFVYSSDSHISTLSNNAPLIENNSSSARPDTSDANMESNNSLYKDYCIISDNDYSCKQNTSDLSNDFSGFDIGISHLEKKLPFQIVDNSNDIVGPNIKMSISKSVVLEQSSLVEGHNKIQMRNCEQNLEIYDQKMKTNSPNKDKNQTSHFNNNVTFVDDLNQISTADFSSPESQCESRSYYQSNCILLELCNQAKISQCLDKKPTTVQKGNSANHINSCDTELNCESADFINAQLQEDISAYQNVTNVKGNIVYRWVDSENETSITNQYSTNKNNIDSHSHDSTHLLNECSLQKYQLQEAKIDGNNNISKLPLESPLEGSASVDSNIDSKTLIQTFHSNVNNDTLISSPKTSLSTSTFSPLIDYCNSVINEENINGANNVEFDYLTGIQHNYGKPFENELEDPTCSSTIQVLHGDVNITTNQSVSISEDCTYKDNSNDQVKFFLPESIAFPSGSASSANIETLLVSDCGSLSTSEAQNQSFDEIIEFDSNNNTKTENNITKSPSDIKSDENSFICLYPCRATNCNSLSPVKQSSVFDFFFNQSFDTTISDDTTFQAKHHMPERVSNNESCVNIPSLIEVKPLASSDACENLTLHNSPLNVDIELQKCYDCIDPNNQSSLKIACEDSEFCIKPCISGCTTEAVIISDLTSTVSSRRIVPHQPILYPVLEIITSTIGNLTISTCSQNYETTDYNNHVQLPLSLYHSHSLNYLNVIIPTKLGILNKSSGIQSYVPSKFKKHPVSDSKPNDCMSHFLNIIIRSLTTPTNCASYCLPDNETSKRICLKPGLHEETILSPYFKQLTDEPPLLFNQKLIERSQQNSSKIVESTIISEGPISTTDLLLLKNKKHSPYPMNCKFNVLKRSYLSQHNTNQHFNEGNCVKYCELESFIRSQEQFPAETPFQDNKLRHCPDNFNSKDICLSPNNYIANQPEFISSAGEEILSESFNNYQLKYQGIALDQSKSNGEEDMANNQLFGSEYLCENVVKSTNVKVNDISSSNYGADKWPKKHNKCTTWEEIANSSNSIFAESFEMLDTITEDSLEGLSCDHSNITEKSNNKFFHSNFSEPSSPNILFWNDHKPYLEKQSNYSPYDEDIQGNFGNFNQWNNSNKYGVGNYCTDEHSLSLSNQEDMQRDSLDGSITSYESNAPQQHSVLNRFYCRPNRKNSYHSTNCTSGFKHEGGTFIPNSENRYFIRYASKNSHQRKYRILPPVRVFKKISKKVEKFYENVIEENSSLPKEYKRQKKVTNRYKRIPCEVDTHYFVSDNSESHSDSDWDSSDSAFDIKENKSGLFCRQSYESVEYNEESNDYHTIKTSVCTLPFYREKVGSPVKLPPIKSPDSSSQLKTTLERRKYTRNEKLPPLGKPESDTEKYNPYLSAERQMMELFGVDTIKPKPSLPEIPHSSPIQSSPTSAFVKYSSPKRTSSVENLKCDNKENNNDNSVVINTSLDEKVNNHKNFSLSNLSLCSVVSIDSVDCNKNAVNSRISSSHLDNFQRSFSALESKSSRTHSKGKVNLQEMLYGSQSPEQATQSESSNSDAGNLEACEAELLISMLEFEKMLKSSPLPSPQSSPPLCSSSVIGDNFKGSPHEDNNIHKNQRNLNNSIDSAYSSLTRSSGADGEKDSGKHLQADLPKFCHECGAKYPVAMAKFCCNCGMRRITM